MAQRGPQQDKRQSPNNPVTDKNPKAAWLVLRKGVWHAGDERCNDFRHALKATLRAAAIATPSRQPAEKPKKPKSEPPSVRLESRAWWRAFIEARKADDWDRALREESRRARWRANDAPPPEPIASATLRERAMAALAERRRA